MPTGEHTALDTLLVDHRVCGANIIKIALNPPTIHSENRIADSYPSHALCCQSEESDTGFSVHESAFAISYGRSAYADLPGKTHGRGRRCCKPHSDRRDSACRS